MIECDKFSFKVTHKGKMFLSTLRGVAASTEVKAELEPKVIAEAP